MLDPTAIPYEYDYGLQPQLHASSFSSEFLEVIDKRVQDPAFATMTPEAFAAYVSGPFVDENFQFDAAKKAFIAYLPYLEEKATRLRLISKNVQPDEYWAIYRDRQSDVWDAHVAAFKKGREEALMAAKIAAIRRSLEFGQLSVYTMAAYWVRLRGVDEIWDAITVLAPREKVREAMHLGHQLLDAQD
jgi:hypothetical protein